MSRLTRWLTRGVGRIVESAPDRGVDLLTLDLPPAERTVSPPSESGEWRRWLARLADAGSEAEILRVSAEDIASLTGAERAEIWRVEDHAAVRSAAWPGEFGGTASFVPPDGRALLEAGRPWRAPLRDAEGDLAAVPLADRPGPVAGWIVVRRGAGAPRFRDGEIERLSEAASMLASFLACARRWSEAREAALRGRELDIARQLREGLRPRVRPEESRIDLAGGVAPVDAVGGGFYGLVSLPDGSIALTVADVAAKGLPAALFLAAARGAIQAQERSAAAPSDLLARVNEILFSDFDAPELSATACHVRLGADPGEPAVYANAGHVPPVVFDRRGRATFLERGGPALGILPDAVYPQGSFAMEPGGAVLLFNEGVLRARGVGGTPYGIERLVDRARRDLGRPAREIRERLLEDMEVHAGRCGSIEESVLVVAKIRESAS